MLVGVSRIYPVDIYPYLISPFISSTIRNGETKTRLISYTMTAPVWLLGTPLIEAPIIRRVRREAGSERLPWSWSGERSAKLAPVDKTVSVGVGETQLDAERFQISMHKRKLCDTSAANDQCYNRCGNKPHSILL